MPRRIPTSRQRPERAPAATRTLLVAACASSLLAAFPEGALACPVCFDRDDEARMAFIATTGLLTLLPLGMVVGVGAWLRKRWREPTHPSDRARPEERRA